MGETAMISKLANLMQNSLKEEEEEVKQEGGELKIPRFFFNDTTNDTKDAEVKDKIKRVLRESILRKKWEEYNNESNLELLQNLLTQHHSNVKSKTDVLKMNWKVFKKVAGLMPKSCHQYFTADTFSKFRRDKFGRIDSHLFFQYVCRHVAFCQTRVQLSTYDSVGDGYLSEMDLECYVKDLIPTLPLLSGMHEDFQPYYIITAVRKFFFMLDPRRTGRIAIKDLITSPVLNELMKLWSMTQQQQQNEPLIEELIEEELEPGKNWFSAPSSLRVYSMYLELDVDHNGMLSREELRQYNNRCLSEVFVNRLFQEYFMYTDNNPKGEMDYKTFLDFILAVENKKTPQGMAYYWRILDVKKTNYLDAYAINFYFREIVKTMIQETYTQNMNNSFEYIEELQEDMVKVEDIINEIFDMISPASSEFITFKDLCKCGVGHIVLTLLTDYRGFLMYENRENIIAEEVREDVLRQQEEITFNTTQNIV